jgi:hypothetical protein
MRCKAINDIRLLPQLSAERYTTAVSVAPVTARNSSSSAE